MSETIAHRLRRFWIAGDPTIRSEAMEAGAIADLERRLGLNLPDDFRRYLQTCAPVGELFDSHYVTWWEPARFVPLPEEYRHPITDPRIAAQAAEYVIFADHIFWCAAWAINCGTGASRGEVIHIGADGHSAVSFEAFVARYLDEPDGVTDSAYAHSTAAPGSSSA